MTKLKQHFFQSLHRAEQNPRPKRSKFCGLRALVVVFSLTLSCLQTVTAQPQTNTARPEPNATERRKAELEVQKLELEVAKLQEVHSEWPTWLPALAGLVIAALSIPASFWAARRAREAALDQATHERRLEFYPQLVHATAPLAIYFPTAISFPSSEPCGGAAAINRSRCGAMGREMCRWYFDGGGLLMSVEARDAYFTFARALTRAALAKQALKVPSFPANAEDLSKEKIDNYVKELASNPKWSLTNVDLWEFGDNNSSKVEGQSPKHEEFKDYVFLQQLSSDLRTKLSEDLYSRRRPS